VAFLSLSEGKKKGTKRNIRTGNPVSKGKKEKRGELTWGPERKRRRGAALNSSNRGGERIKIPLVP